MSSLQQQFSQIDRLFRTLVRRLPGDPEGHARGQALIGALAEWWRKLAREAGNAGATDEAMTEWHSMYEKALREITLAAAEESEREVTLGA